MAKSNGKRPQEIDAATRRAAWDELCRLRIRGAKQKECARLLGFHVNTIKKWMSQEEWKVLYMRTRALVFQRTQDAGDAAAERKSLEIEKRIEAYADEAIEKIKSLMHGGKSETVQFYAARDLADRSPRTSRTKKIQTANLHALVTPEMLATAVAATRDVLTNIALGKVVTPLPLDESMADALDIDGV